MFGPVVAQIDHKILVYMLLLKTRANASLSFEHNWKESSPNPGQSERLMSI
jgi:hypothetical protein